MPKHPFVRQCPGCQYLVPPTWERCKRCDADLACARARSLVGAGTRATAGSAPATDPSATPGTFGAARFGATEAAPRPTDVAPRPKIAAYAAFTPSTPVDVRGGYERVPTAGESWASIHQAPPKRRLPLVGFVTTVAILAASWFAWQQATARHLPEAWKPYVEGGQGVEHTSAAGRFSVELPVTPRELTQSLIIGGRRFDVAAVLSTPDGEADSAVGVVWVDLPSDMLATTETDALLQGYADDWAAVSDAQVSELDFISVQGFHAVDASFADGDVKGQVRIVIAGTRVYLLIAGGTEQGAIGFGRLVESFEIA